MGRDEKLSFYCNFLKIIFLIFKNEAFKYFLSTILGGLVTYFTLMMVEKSKTNNIIRSWLSHLLIEVKENNVRKMSALYYLYGNIQSNGYIENKDFVNTFSSNFQILNSCFNSGIFFEKKIWIIALYSKYKLLEPVNNDSCIDYLNQFLDSQGNIFNKKLAFEKTKEIIKIYENDSIEIYKLSKQLEDQCRKFNIEIKIPKNN
ncbi:MAG: hypothetical protein NTV16_01505 [Actinobacteria bacterium]|nr:hypothetical protein [Actinomycetota bacterium]